MRKQPMFVRAKHEFSLGSGGRNFYQVFGYNPALWFLPVHSRYNFFLGGGVLGLNVLEFLLMCPLLVFSVSLPLCVSLSMLHEPASHLSLLLLLLLLLCR